MRYSAVIFDMGDIFFDATQWRRSLTACLQSHGVAIDYPTFAGSGRRNWSRSTWAAAITGMPFAGDCQPGPYRRGSQEVVDFASAKAAEVEQRTLFDGVAETLPRLESGRPEVGRALRHRKPRPRVRRRLAKLGIDQHFDAVLTSMDIGYVKPSREAYAAALSRLGVRAGRSDLRRPRPGRIGRSPPLRPYNRRLQP